MERHKILSGYELVEKGITKLGSSLPEIGQKEIVPNGSWLEQKQVQSALEERKHLLEIERIEKCGALSHAEWKEDLELAEVTKKVGGHWQYLGHNVGKQLYLKPEEALFLMEVNCLHLTYNELTVSLQQAYALLLSGEMTLLRYKVYASLSRLGYKVFRHDDSNKVCGKETNLSSEEQSGNVCPSEVVAEDGDQQVKDVNMEDKIEDNSIRSEHEISLDESKRDIDENVCEDICTENGHDNSSEDLVMEIETINAENNATGGSSQDLKENVEKADSVKQCPKIESCRRSRHSKLQDLENRKVKPCNNKVTDNFYDKVPDLYQQQTVTVKVPEEEHIPKNVFLNNVSYVLNLENVRANIKNSRPQSSSSRSYSVSEEVNGPHIFRINDTTTNNPPPFYQNPGFARQQFRQFPFWRPRQNIFSWRPFLPSIYFVPRFHFYPRQPPPLFRPPPNQFNTFQTNFNQNFNAGTQSTVKSNPVINKRNRKNKKYHLEHIRKLTSRLKNLVRSGIACNENKIALHEVVQTYNTRYSAGLRVTPEFDLIDDELILDTIELEDEDEVGGKRPRIEEIDFTGYDENLEKLKKLSIKLKNLEANHKSSSRHRRAFSHLVKKFNKLYEADVYVGDNYEIKDRNRIILDDSSDSDCVMDESSSTSQMKKESIDKPGGKKLKNPFNILKKLSEKSKTLSGCSNDSTLFESTDKRTENTYSQTITTVFDKNWLPSYEDFGRPEIPKKDLMYDFITSSNRNQYIYDFIKNQGIEFENWLEAKIHFLRDIEAKTAAIEEDVSNQKEVKIDSIVKPEDCTDMQSVLRKLSVIQTFEEAHGESDMAVHFDVYNRDVQNFRKSSKPKPHFRVICTSESSEFPSGNDIATIHAKYEDNVPLLFAVVGIDSVSFLQINPSNIPVYISSNDLT